MNSLRTLQDGSSRTAADLLRMDLQSRSIPLCKVFDSSLNDGFKLGVITELAGFSGCGKTQLCLQLCVNTVMPGNVRLDRGGANAVFIDTRNGFFPERLREIAEASFQILRDSNFLGKALIEDPEYNSVEKILARIHCSQICAKVDLEDILKGLKSFMMTTTNVRLIVIDSFSTLFTEVYDHFERIKGIYCFLAKLQKLADNYDCAVVITNDLTTSFQDKQPFIQPSLGESFHHRVTQRVLLGRLNDKDLFCAQVQKNLFKPKSEFSFRITSEGVRDHIEGAQEAKQD